jgi:hypothetical protein
VNAIVMHVTIVRSEQVNACNIVVVNSVDIVHPTVTNGHVGDLRDEYSGSVRWCRYFEALDDDV